MMLDVATPALADVRLLDGGYARETRALLYASCEGDAVFNYMFEDSRPDYEERIKSAVRGLVNQHFLQDLPALGLFVEDRLLGVALITPPNRRLDITESWAWRLRMLASTGLECTRRYLDYHEAVITSLPSATVHVLPLLGFAEDADEAQVAQLLVAVHDWCAEDEHSDGVALDTANPRHVQFLERQGYTQVGEIFLDEAVGRVLFHPAPAAVAPPAE